MCVCVYSISCFLACGWSTVRTLSKCPLQLRVDRLSGARGEEPPPSVCSRLKTVCWVGDKCGHGAHLERRARCWDHSTGRGCRSRGCRSRGWKPGAAVGVPPSKGWRTRSPPSAAAVPHVSAKTQKPPARLCLRLQRWCGKSFTRSGVFTVNSVGHLWGEGGGGCESDVRVRAFPSISIPAPAPVSLNAPSAFSGNT